MFRSRFALMLCAAGLAACLGLTASAAEVDCDGVYCFSPADFQDTSITGICVTGVPDSGTLMLDSRIIRPGDILTAGQLENLKFDPFWTETDREATLRYLPVFAHRVAPESAATISIRGKVNQPPVAVDFMAETYKNLPCEGKLQVSDPEGQKMTFTLIRKPRRGTLEIRPDGTFLYTPKKNKVGVESFVYTAADPEGNVSRQATVTIRILKPSDSALYTDTAGTGCRFTAEWMKNTGIFAGEQVGADACFSPEKPVTRGEFLAMTMKTLAIPPAPESRFTGFADDSAPWLRPYLAAALRRGLVSGYSGPEGPVFRPQQNITPGEAAVILRQALALPAPVLSPGQDAPVWSTAALMSVRDSGIALEDGPVLTRAQAANALYGASRLVLRQEQDSRKP